MAYLPSILFYHRQFYRLKILPIIFVSSDIFTSEKYVTFLPMAIPSMLFLQMTF